MDHLERLKEGNSVAWKYPDIESTQILFNDWVIPVTVVGDWNITKNARHMKFELKNIKDIEKEFSIFVNKYGFKLPFSTIYLT